MSPPDLTKTTSAPGGCSSVLLSRAFVLCLLDQPPNKDSPTPPVLPLEGLRGAVSAGLESYSLQQPPWAGCLLIFLAYLLELLML